MFNSLKKNIFLIGLFLFLLKEFKDNDFVLFVLPCLHLMV